MIRRYLPKVANVLAKALKPIAGIFILVIVGFGIYANLYMIQLMDTMVSDTKRFVRWKNKITKPSFL